MGDKNLISVNHYKSLGAVLNIELSDDKDIQRQLQYQYCAENKLRASFSRSSKAVKNVHFGSFCTPCMHNKYGGISESHSCKDCVWPIFLDAEFHTTCPGERVLVVMTYQVQCTCVIPTLETLLRKNVYLFLERCRRSNNVWLPALMQSDCLYPSLFFEHCNRILLCGWVLEHCSVCSFHYISFLTVT